MSKVMDELVGNAQGMMTLLNDLQIAYKYPLKEGEHFPCPEHGGVSCHAHVSSGNLICFGCPSDPGKDHHLVAWADLYMQRKGAATRAEALQMMERTLQCSDDERPPCSGVDKPAWKAASSGPGASADENVDYTYTRIMLHVDKQISNETLDLFGVHTTTERFGKHSFPVCAMPAREGYKVKLRVSEAGGRFRYAYGPELKTDAYGVDQCSQSAHLPNTLIVVEGETDVLTLHDLQLPCAVGVPGKGAAFKVARPLLEACAKIGEGDPSAVDVVVWVEPGADGFYDSVVRALSSAAEKAEHAPPSFIRLHHAEVEGAPGDPTDMRMDAPDTDTARLRLLSALGKAPEPQSGIAALQQSPAPAPDPEPKIGSSDPWARLVQRADCPAAGLIGEKEVSSAQIHAQRSAAGWHQIVLDEEGNPKKPKFICSPMVVERVENAAGELHAVIAAPQPDKWTRERFKVSDLQSKERGIALLAGRLGVFVESGMRPKFVNLVNMLYERRRDADGVQTIPPATGWGDSVASSLFAGIECDAAEPQAAQMFRANENRRKQHPDEVASARVWWDALVDPLLSKPEPMEAKHAASVIALGTAAAGPLVLPIGSLGLKIGPVAWISGFGGGGKTSLQRVCASIFAPDDPAFSGQRAYFMSADITRAALNNKAQTTRDLPLILDDLTQMPHIAERGRTDDAKIEAAASMGMQIFNREPAERARTEGGNRESHPFRATGLFSAEVGLRQARSAQISSGHRRRLTLVDAEPVADRGIDQEWIDDSFLVTIEHGGAAGSLLVKLIREVVVRRELGDMLSRVKMRVRESAHEDIERTQQQSLTIQVLGFCLLAQACGAYSFDDALDLAMDLMQPFFDDPIHGALTNGEMRQVEVTLERVNQFYKEYQSRIINPHAVDMDDDLQLASFASTLGKVVRERGVERRKKLCLLPSAMTILADKFGIMDQQVESAARAGVCKPNDFASVKGSSTQVVSWFIDFDEQPDDDDPDETPPHDPDPHNLKSNLSDEDAAEVAASLAVFKEALPDAAPQSRDELADSLDAQLVEHASDYEALAASDPIASIPTHPLDRFDVGDFKDTNYYVGDYLEPIAKFSWATGMYEPLACADPHEVLAAIRKDAREEFAGLFEFSRVLGKQVDPIPADDDPRWEQLSRLGTSGAAALWDRVNGSSWLAAKCTDDPGELNAAMERRNKDYRLHILARLRHPEWFVA